MKSIEERQRIELEVADRRRKVATMLLARATQAEIARLLGCASSAVSADVAALRKEWADEHREAIATILAQDLAALNRDEASLRARLAALDADKHFERIRYHELLLRIMERRTKVVGISPEATRSKDTPSEVDQTSSPGGRLAILYRKGGARG